MLRESLHLHLAMVAGAAQVSAAEHPDESPSLKSTAGMSFGALQFGHPAVAFADYGKLRAR
jgi:hypothetical protein